MLSYGQVNVRNGQKRKSRPRGGMSAMPRIVLQKSFWGDDKNFSGPLMRFARGDMRDHIVSHKNDHGASYGRYGVLQWQSRLKISFARFSASSIFDFCDTICQKQ